MTETRTFNAGDVMFRQGDSASGEAYLVHEGAVEVRRTEDGEDRILRTLGKGDLLGEVALFRSAPHSATAVAIEPVTSQSLRTRPGTRGAINACSRWLTVPLHRESTSLRWHGARNDDAKMRCERTCECQRALSRLRSWSASRATTTGTSSSLVASSR